MQCDAMAKRPPMSYFNTFFNTVIQYVRKIIAILKFRKSFYKPKGKMLSRKLCWYNWWELYNSWKGHSHLLYFSSEVALCDQFPCFPRHWFMCALCVVCSVFFVDHWFLWRCRWQPDKAQCRASQSSKSSLQPPKYMGRHHKHPRLRGGSQSAFFLLGGRVGTTLHVDKSGPDQAVSYYTGQTGQWGH